MDDGLELTVEREEEEDGRWIAEVMELPGVLAYGPSREAAFSRAQALALRVLAERLERGDGIRGWASLSFTDAN